MKPAQSAEYVAVSQGDATLKSDAKSRCPQCGKAGGFYWHPYWMHDEDNDAWACSLGNNWQVGPDGSVVPWGSQRAD